MKIGQLLLIGISGIKPSKDLLNFIKKENIGGVILFEENFESVKQLTNLIKKLQQASDGNLFIAIDQEGGRVIRLRKPFTEFPSLRDIAQKKPELTYNIAKAIGSELSSVGINVNFSPVLDVNTNAFNPIIGDRSFGEDIDVVKDLGLKMMQGFLDAHVMPCGKHFPGHGDTDIDSHKGLPVLHHTKNRMYKCEFIPFKFAIENDIPAIMTAHILVPNLDNKPATISKIITTHILRTELKFRGLIFSDDLFMHGITKLMSVEDAAVASLQAGSDQVLLCRDFEKQKISLDKIKKAVDKGEILDVEEKLKRIFEAKQRFCNTEKKPSKSIIGCKSHQKLSKI